MTRRRRTWLALAGGLMAASLIGRGQADTGPDPLAADLSRWSKFMAANPSTDDTWKQVRQGSEPALARAAEALRDGRRLLAMLRLAPVRENLYAAVYLAERTPEQRRDMASFESEWRRVGHVLDKDPGRGAAVAPAMVRPVAIRAMVEVAASKVPIYYQASLEYGRNTTPESGLFYLGAAQAQRDFIEFARRLSPLHGPPPPPVPGLEAGLDALHSEVLAAYRPPASIEKHPEFIAASSLIKEARELAADGRHYGALLRYLQAAIRFGPLREGLAATDTAAIGERLKGFEARLATAGVDHSLGRLLVEAAQADLAEHGAAEGAAATAAAISGDVLPRYFAALAPTPPRPGGTAPTVTVTLVRWPYT